MQLRELHRFFELLQKRRDCGRAKTARGAYGAQPPASEAIWRSNWRKAARRPPGKGNSL
jgi:hypothetical protein